MVTKLDRLARSLPAARDIVEELTTAACGCSWAAVHDPTEPRRRLLFNVLAMFAEFESDLINARTREGLRLPALRASSADASPSSRQRAAAGTTAAGIGEAGRAK